MIRCIRETRVILDADLARVYGVETKHLNQAYKRNIERFPADFAFTLNNQEVAMMRSQIVTASNAQDESKRNVRHLPIAFTEHGALMAATILNSPKAVAMSVYVIRAFIRMREDLAANAEILKRLAEIDKTLLIHDSALRDIYQKLRPLLEPPPMSEKPQIGFHIKEEASRYRVKRPRGEGRS